MLSLLKNHPFAIQAFFENSLVLTYALPAEVLQPLIPAPLEMELFQDKWAFVALAVVKTQGLRPKGFPAFMGNDFILAGYRVFVRYTTSQGKRLRGLFILKSETNKKKMQYLGNLFTHYHYATTDMKVVTDNALLEVTSVQSGIQVSVDTGQPDTALPATSPFSSWKEARRFAGPLPFTFTCEPGSDKVLIIEGVREHWTPQPVKVNHAEVGFLRQPAFRGARLANAFLIRQIPYYWKKGKTDIWKR